MSNINQEAHKIQLRSEEIQEILGTPPSWLTNWGTAIIISIIFAIFTLSYFVSYPDTIEGDFRIMSANAPVSIKATFDGQVSDVLVKENQLIKKGTPLFVIQSNAKYGNVVHLRNILEPLVQMNVEMLLTTQLPMNLQLGSLSNQYSELIEAYSKLKTKKARKYENFKINSIFTSKKKYKKQISKLEDKILVAEKNRNKAQDDLSLLLANYGSDKTITNEILKDKKNQISTYLNSILAFKEQQDNLKDKIQNLATQSNEIRIEKTDKDQISIDQVRYNANKLLTDIKNWEDNFLIKSPVNGKVLFYPNKKISQQYFKTGNNILAVKPTDTTIEQKENIGHVYINKEDYDKIEINQPILISFKGHPTMKYGKLEAIVSKKTELIENDKFIIETIIPNPTITTTGQTINIKNELEGKAEIITDEKNILYRFFHEIL